MTTESDYFGRIREFPQVAKQKLSVLDVKSQIGFKRFVESFDLYDFEGIYPYTDYAGFHATDPNWYEEGGYQPCLLRANLFEHLEGLLKAAELLEADQQLTPVCHYSEDPGRAWLFPFLINDDIPRPNLVIEVIGGEKDDWGQFICFALSERRFFETVDDMEYVSVAFGRQEGAEA